ncbi:MAG TPA: LLM class flavin-dependent oxidoreductase [Candidatus Saccharimonadales bacterium]|nr:LLM class flavin-dependent oxidoreductase [Candidatus Saccharimonadales bacterium]
MASFGFYADMDGIQFDELKEMALDAERLGYDSFWLFDHLHSFPTPDRQPILESWTTLSALTMVTKRIRIGILVTNIQNRLPSLVAKMAATVDVISNGRLEMGLGAGGTGRSSVHQKSGYLPEYQAYGTPFSEKASIRIRRLDEAIQIMRLMWTKERATFNGKYYHVKDAICNPHPIQKPHPPIWIAGQGEKYLLSVAAKYADAVNLHWNLTPDGFERKLRVLKEHCKHYGTDYSRITKSLAAGVLLAEGQREFSDLKENLVKRYRGLEGFTPYALQESGITGTLEQCESKIASFIQSGVQYFILNFTELEQARMFAKTIIPHFRD